MSENQESNSVEKSEPQFNAAQIQYAWSQLRNEQNLTMGALAGAIAALIGAALWALITVITEYQIGWIAVGVGFLVGFAVRTYGKGVDKTFGVIGAVLALIGCGLGNLLAVCGIIAAEQDMRFFAVLSRLDFNLVKELMVASFSPIDLLFYGIAVYEGYKLSLRRLTEKDVAASIAGLPQGTQGK